MALVWGLLPPRTVDGIHQDGFFAYASAANGKTYEIWPAADPAVHPPEEWVLTLGVAGRSDQSDSDDSEDLGRFDDFAKAQLEAELHDIANPA